MKHTTLILACIFFQLAAITAVNADGGWVTIASSNDGTTWQARSGSLEFTQTKGGTPIAVVTGRVTQRSPSRITVEKWYVPVADCVKEQGTLVTLNISGEFMYENDFVFGSENVASGMAELICGAAKQMAIEASNKGL